MKPADIKHRRRLPRAVLTSDALNNERQRSTYLEAILNNAADGIITIDYSGIILSINPAGAAMFGYEMKELISKNVGKLMDTDDGVATYNNYIKEYDKTGEGGIIGQTAREIRGRRKNGEVIYMEISVNPLVIEDETVYIGIMRDITELKESANEIAKAYELLQVEVRNLEEAKDELRANREERELYIRELQEKEEIATTANRTKSAFLANMSHELRTPLNAIIGFSEIIISQAFGPVGERYVGYCADILNSGQHLLTVINDILDLSKIEAGKIDLYLSDVSLSSAANTSYRLISERAMNKNINVILDIENDVTFNADEAKIKQILLNLMTNAIKFTPEGGEVSVTVGEYNKTVCFIVADTGIGMDEKGVEKALAKFGQVESNLSRSQEGTGLGLPLTVELVKLHGGDLSIESELGKGTTVTVSIPI